MLQARHIAWLGCLIVAVMPWTSAVHAQVADDASIEARLRRFAAEPASQDAALPATSAGQSTDAPSHTHDMPAQDADVDVDSTEAVSSTKPSPFVGPHADFENRRLGSGAANAFDVSDVGSDGLVPPKAGSGWVMQTITALGVVIGLIFLLRAVANRVRQPAMGTSNNAVVEVLSRVAVGQRHHVLLMRLGQRVLVVGETAGGMQTLATVDDAQVERGTAGHKRAGVFFGQW